MTAVAALVKCAVTAWSRAPLEASIALLVWLELPVCFGLIWSAAKGEMTRAGRVLSLYAVAILTYYAIFLAGGVMQGELSIQGPYGFAEREIAYAIAGYAMVFLGSELDRERGGAGYRALTMLALVPLCVVLWLYANGELILLSRVVSALGTSSALCLWHANRRRITRGVSACLFAYGALLICRPVLVEGLLPAQWLSYAELPYYFGMLLGKWALAQLPRSGKRRVEARNRLASLDEHDRARQAVRA